MRLDRHWDLEKMRHWVRKSEPNVWLKRAWYTYHEIREVKILSGDSLHIGAGCIEVVTRSTCSIASSGNSLRGGARYGFRPGEAQRRVPEQATDCLRYI